MKKTNKTETFDVEAVTRGNDIEFHIWDREEENMVSAIEVLNCDKNNPIDLKDGIKVYADNILIETSFPPYITKSEMFERFSAVFGRIQERIGNRYRLVPLAAYEYDNSQLQDPKALEVGCSANFNAYTMSINDMVAFNSGWRTSGYHCHLGAEQLTNFDTRINTIKLLDIILGLSSVIFNNEKTEIVRRDKYGCASEHRPTPFGLEYRCLSPYTLRSKEIIDLTYDLITLTLNYISQGKELEIIESMKEKDIIRAINTCDVILSKSLLEKSGVIPSDLMKRVKQDYKDDFYSSWNIPVAEKLNLQYKTAKLKKSKEKVMG